MTLLFQARFEVFNPSGIFGVEFAAGFEGAPVGSYALFPLGGIFRGGMSGDPGEYAGGDGTADVGAMLPGKDLPYFVYGDELSSGDFFHYLIDFGGSGNYEGSGSPSFTHFPGDFFDSGEVFVVGQLFTP